jgi:hypothetical protein
MSKPHFFIMIASIAAVAAAALGLLANYSGLLMPKSLSASMDQGA